MNNKKITSNLASYLVLTIVSLIVLFPFFWMVSTSLKTESEVFLFPPQWIPAAWEWINYIRVFTEMPFHLYFFNSMYIAVLVTAGTCFLSALAGYAFARLHFPFKNAIFLFLLSGMMIPTEVTAIPLFSWMSNLGFIDTHIPLILPPMLGSGGMFGVFLIRQFLITVPIELDEAAKMDGCSPWRTFRSIMLPIATPALATVSIFTFMNSWNEFFEPLIYLNTKELFTLPIGLSMLTTDAGVDWPLLLAASTIATVPILVVFFLAQNKFIEGIANTGLK
ncbi:sn-glycerol-3-phosphate transport system permease protein UgpE [Paenibacillus lautus]|uniref:carbohydrate ABC transporter permease n=1 Tax=Paenibacillus lautus TaxID=1401 RepID=UPI001B0F222D|nr:carbohydrate ABC transporter permease [Paenibacillus lautus]GIO99417.1 sn-glycerol-3-phosphate transport system permease protein UgpE [Paenibacillus lautus]